MSTLAIPDAVPKAIPRKSSSAPAPSATSGPPSFGVLDAVMTLLALTSVGLVLLDVFFRRSLYEWGIFSSVMWADLAITLVFLVEFTALSRKDGFLRHARSHWFDLLGMVPMIAFVAVEAALLGVPLGAAVAGTVRLTGASGAGGVLRLFRFVRVVRVVAAWSRFLRATNMTFGEQVTKRLFDRYRRIVVAELTTPILVAGITVSQELIIRMKFMESAGMAIDAKRADIHAAVIEALRRNKVPENVLTKPLVERIVSDVERSVVDTVVETLTGPELNKLTQELIVEVLQNFKDQLHSPEGREALRNLDLDGAARTVPVTAPK